MNRLPRLAHLTPESSGWGFFLCTSRETRATRTGEIVILTLQDASGQVTAKILEDPERTKGEFDAGEFIRVDGHASLYNGQLQLVIHNLRRVNPDQDRQQGFREDDCVLSAPRPIDEMWAELTRHLDDVRDPFLRVLFARAYDAREELVITGAVLHDIGKLQELSYDAGITSYSRDGNLLGHIAMGVMLVRDTANGISGFPDDLRTHVEHLVLSHHGSKEHGSPVEPKTIEAFILAAADELDATINQVQRAVREDVGAGDFTAYHRRLGRVLYKGE
ncbi:MAG: HD domain-containing protein [Acidobacteria bacterium]|nr:HD domain-containing protein [Acidobacteriota bacterium]